MKANRIPRIDTTKTPSPDTRTYGGPHVAGVEFDDGLDSFQIHLDSPSLAPNGRRVALGGVRDHGTIGAAETIDFRQAAYHKVLSTTGVAFTLTLTGGVAGNTYFIAVKRVSTEAATWTTVKWPAGTAPTLTAAGATVMDLFRFTFDGTNYVGSTVALNYAI